MFADNEITEVTDLDAVKLSRLHTLELRGNKLETTTGIYLPNLKNLFLVSTNSTPTGIYLPNLKNLFFVSTNSRQPLVSTCPI